MSFLIFYILVNLVLENRFLKTLLRNMPKKKLRQIFVYSNSLELILDQRWFWGAELHNFNNHSVFLQLIPHLPEVPVENFLSSAYVQVSSYLLHLFLFELKLLDLFGV